jgi:hypothetical protein
MARAYVSLIQSDYDRSRHGNFEAVIVHGTEQRHDDFEVPARSGAEVGLDDAAGSGDCIVIIGNTWSANPRTESRYGSCPGTNAAP